MSQGLSCGGTGLHSLRAHLASPADVSWPCWKPRHSMEHLEPPRAGRAGAEDRGELRPGSCCRHAGARPGRAGGTCAQLLPALSLPSLPSTHRAGKEWKLGRESRIFTTVPSTLCTRVWHAGLFPQGKGGLILKSRFKTIQKSEPPFSPRSRNFSARSALPCPAHHTLGSEMSWENHVQQVWEAALALVSD